ncbi:MAG: OmpA family protein [Haliea sp.]|uniref:OmpA family protein n=1 Tax=Haliea sp. TaxID=1932666 RepID=UPI0032EB37F0
MQALSNEIQTRRRLPLIGAILPLLLTACSAIPGVDSPGQPGSPQLPIEPLEAQAPPGPVSAGPARGELAVGPALAKLAANAEALLLPEQTGYYMDVQYATLRKRFVDTDVTLAREGDQLRLVLPGSATFDSGSADVTERASLLLRDVAEVLAEYDRSLVVVEGHSDSVGAASFNQSLSEQRALAVAAMLQENGVVVERLVVVGYGPDRPVTDNDTERGRAQNRRVELLVRPVTGP